MTTLHSVHEAIAAGNVVAALYPLRDAPGVAILREERAEDIPAREALLDRAFGAARFAKTSERLRDGRLPAEGLALAATVDGALVGTVRLWHVDAGGCDALLLGPLAVDDAYRSSGIGGALMREAIGRAQARGHESILLVGDAPYYARFGFSGAATRALDLPGPVDRARFLALELQDRALAAACGPVVATGSVALRKAVLEAAA